MVARAKISQKKQRNSELLTRVEAAEYLGISENTLAIWNCTGRYNLPVVKVGRLAKYRRSDLDLFLNRRTMNGGPSDTVPHEVDWEGRSSIVERQAGGGVEFREVQLVERREPRAKQSSGASAGLEVILPSGITLRLAPGCSLDLLSSVITALENA